ncbi:hypothetical protein F8388_014339 [Cannabis sativa]|uniref:Dynamin-related protein 3A n=1 Tax=Cannabis sativa TaxID=3483 RepID=A0A7J6EJF4_CANSA|nr:hypothetical protein F8388_014339 [Cannabis sativa]
MGKGPAAATIGSSLVPIINKLQEIIAPVGNNSSLDISLPLVAVIGSQSSGKSSVLEALVGRDFLPRGCDICTRRPLLLVLENRPETDDEGAEWGEFRHLPGKRFYDFSKIRREIQISSPNVLNMMLVDLPGITKVPVGDQPSDIEARVRKMIMTQIRQEKCIILAVSPANSDLATSDALQMAREADPTGSRTIGVITKLDIMDRGTNARNFLLGKVIPLRLGYIGVINRSQEDINKNRSIADALSREETFFRDHPVYSGLPSSCGIPQLSRKLNQILEQHIRMALPSLKSELNSEMSVVGKELQKYENMAEANMEKGVILLNILSKYCEDFSALVDGCSKEISTKELSGGARINYIIHSIFIKSLEEVDPCEGLTDDDIRITIQNAAGARNALIVPEAPFEVLVRAQIARLLDPSLQCVRYVHDELMKMDWINYLHPNFLSGRKAVKLALEQLRSQQESRSSVNNEKPTSSGGNTSTRTWGIPSMSSVNSSPRTWGIPSMFGTRGGSSEGKPVSNTTVDEPNGCSNQMPCTIQLTEPPSILRPLEATESETVEICVTKSLIQSYYDIVRKNIQDLVPKAIMHFLVNHTKRKLQSTFTQKLYSGDLFEELLLEDDEVVSKRKCNQELFLVLQEAIEMLEEVESDVSTGSSTIISSSSSVAGITY